MAFPTTLTNAVDGVTEIEAAHLNNLEAKVGIDHSEDPDTLDYMLRHAGSIDPGHKHTAGAFSGGNDGDVFHKSGGAWTPKTLDAAGGVDKASNQNVGGIKTFTEIPVLPASDPASPNQAARKGYVDNAIDTDVAAHAALPNAHHSQVHALTGADHTVSGLTPGQVLRATGPNSCAFQAIQESDLPVHKHNKLWEQDGGAEAVYADDNGVLNIPAKTAPAGSAADTAQVWSEDVNGEAGKAGLHIANEVLPGVKLIVPGVYLKTSTGDPANRFEGMLVINTVDNTLKIYADAGWRQLATWT
ncbi:MAG: hypothetical protein FJ135_01875 [Deltaproteobacteria bacterium]|nr:hypothetical protein [Deltaproteobacteria bacterium]